MRYTPGISQRQPNEQYSLEDYVHPARRQRLSSMVDVILKVKPRDTVAISKFTIEQFNSSPGIPKIFTGALCDEETNNPAEFFDSLRHAHLTARAWVGKDIFSFNTTPGDEWYVLVNPEGVAAMSVAPDDRGYHTIVAYDELGIPGLLYLVDKLYAVNKLDKAFADIEVTHTTNPNWSSHPTYLIFTDSECGLMKVKQNIRMLSQAGRRNTQLDDNDSLSKAIHFWIECGYGQELKDVFDENINEFIKYRDTFFPPKVEIQEEK